MIGCPACVVCSQAMAFTDQIFVGHLGTDEMAAAALANTVRVLSRVTTAERGRA